MAIWSTGNMAILTYEVTVHIGSNFIIHNTANVFDITEWIISLDIAPQYKLLRKEYK